MIWACLKIACTAIIFEFVVDWFRGLTEPSDDFNYCYNCQYGWCMETPKTEGCIRWEKDKG